jgi:hypothetical protein
LETVFVNNNKKKKDGLLNEWFKWDFLGEIIWIAVSFPVRLFFALFKHY